MNYTHPVRPTLELSLSQSLNTNSLTHRRSDHVLITHSPPQSDCQPITLVQGLCNLRQSKRQSKRVNLHAGYLAVGQTYHNSGHNKHCFAVGFVVSAEGRSVRIRTHRRQRYREKLPCCQVQLTCCCLLQTHILAPAAAAAAACAHPAAPSRKACIATHITTVCETQLPM